jgi:hypothetical protein
MVLAMVVPAVVAVVRAVQQEQAVAVAVHLLVSIFSIMVRVLMLYNQVF